MINAQCPHLYLNVLLSELHNAEASEVIEALWTWNILPDDIMRRHATDPPTWCYHIGQCMVTRAVSRLPLIVVDYPGVERLIVEFSDVVETRKFRVFL